jgi:hypothetical protein
MPSILKYILGILGLAGLVALGAALAQPDNHGHPQPKRISTDPEPGTKGPP